MRILFRFWFFLFLVHAAAMPPFLCFAKTAQAADRSFLLSETENDLADAGEGNETDSTETAAIPFSYNGFIEWESFINIFPDQEFSDAFKKHEIRNHLEIRWGDDERYMFIGSDIYAQPLFWRDDEDKDYRYTSDSGVKRNLRIAATDYEIAFNELYFNFQMRNYRLRLGNQLYNWGTADAINPTGYFNPYDMREFFFRDEDEQNLGVPSVSGMYFGDEITLEMVFTPVHIPMLLASSGNFWSLQQENPLYSLHFGDTDGMSVEMKNFGYGIRGSTGLWGGDLSLSAYHGPDRDSIFVPASVTVRPNLPMVVEIEQQYEVVDMFGMDFSRPIEDLVVQFEIAYSPNKSNIVEQNVSFENIRLPFKTESSDYISYATGFNYFIPLHRLLKHHEGESVFTFEWYQAKFFEKEVSQPYLLTDLMYFKYEDTFLGGRLPLKITSIFDTRNGSSIFWPKIGWDFQNGLTCDIFYIGINGRSDDSDLVQNPFFYFRNNDMVGFNIRYRY